MTIDEQIKCVARELALRKSVYHRLVEWQRMTQAAADHEIAAMEAVLQTLVRVKAFETES